MSPKSCPCTSGKSYKSCCEPYHKGELPTKAVELMRSRFSAYAMGNHAYIIKTTDPTSPVYRKNVAKWRKWLKEYTATTTFLKLHILNLPAERFGEADLTVTAVLLLHVKDISFTERSLFRKEKGRWLYVRPLNL